jgi:hypothetical protein
MLVFTFDDDGIEAIDHGDAAEIISEVTGGPVVRRRATHIVPVNTVKRLTFKLIRFVTGDGKRLRFLEEWTRHWKGPHLADLRPSGGRVVGPFPSRQSAINYEIDWLAANI